MRSSVAAILLALCLTAPAVGQETNEARVDTPPEWVNRPTREDLVAVFPGSPQAARGGRATVTCTVTVLGGLRACRVDGETPEGAGFGAAALSLTLQFTMRPATRGGRPVESQVRIPLTWPAMPMSDRRPGETRPMISHPHWARAPTFAQVAAAIPSNARRRAVDGRATIGCSFNHDGTLRDCRVLSENPPGLGFGLAAQGLTRQFQLQTIGLPTGFRVRDAGVVIPFSFPANAGATDAPVLGRPRWVTRPNADSAATAYPAAALAANVSGSGLVACSVGPNGALADCAVVSESPEGQGFGAAALRLSTAFTMGLWSDEGLPTHGARVTLPIMFRPPPPADAPPASPAP